MNINVEHIVQKKVEAELKKEGFFDALVEEAIGRIKKDQDIMVQRVAESIQESAYDHPLSTKLVEETLRSLIDNPKVQKKVLQELIQQIEEDGYFETLGGGRAADKVDDAISKKFIEWIKTINV